MGVLISLTLIISLYMHIKIHVVQLKHTQFYLKCIFLINPFLMKKIKINNSHPDQNSNTKTKKNLSRLAPFSGLAPINLSSTIVHCFLHNYAFIQ